MITRDRDPQDERAVAVTLTPEGREARQQALRVPTAIVDKLGMPVEELEALRDSLTRLIQATRHQSEADEVAS